MVFIPHVIRDVFVRAEFKGRRDLLSRVYIAEIRPGMNHASNIVRDCTSAARHVGEALGIKTERSVV